MNEHRNHRGRGRPRGFDTDEAIRIGQRLFHEHGYEGVNLAMLVEAIGITPPSFYAAFGSKSAFFEAALRSYALSTLPLASLLGAARPAREALGDLLGQAAQIYGADPRQRGCLVLEHARTGDTPHGSAARRVNEADRAQVRAFLDAQGVPNAGPVADHVAITMLGLSAAACEGWDASRLAAVAEIAVAAMERMLAGR